MRLRCNLFINSNLYKKYIANSLAKKLLAIQSNKKQYCQKVTSQGSLIIYCNYLIVSFLWFLWCKVR
jgi:hypothetical protein